MAERRYEFCVFDPEGDYDDLKNAVSVGDSKVPPNVDEVLELLRKAGGNVVINTQSLAVSDRPAFFAKLLPKIAELRGRTGRPHWLLVDEAHHLRFELRMQIVGLPCDDPGTGPRRNDPGEPSERGARIFRAGK